IGRGVLTFSISSTMALASYTPTQIGSTVSLPTSLSSTIGMFETGSIISPRIFISNSIGTSTKHSPVAQAAEKLTLLYQGIALAIPQRLDIRTPLGAGCR